MQERRSEVGTLERRTPARAPSLRADVSVQLAKSLIVGVSGGGVLTLLLYPLALATRSAASLLEPSMGSLSIPWLQAWGIFALCIFLLYFVWYDAIMRETLWVIERVTGHDIDGDEVLGKPQEVVHTFVNGTYSSMVPRGADPVKEDCDAFWGFISSIGKKGTAERNWSGLGARYDAWKDWLIKNGYAYVVHPAMRNSAWALKDGVKIEEVFRHYKGW